MSDAAAHTFACAAIAVVAVVLPLVAVIGGWNG